MERSLRFEGASGRRAASAIDGKTVKEGKQTLGEAACLRLRTPNRLRRP